MTPEEIQKMMEEVARKAREELREEMRVEAEAKRAEAEAKKAENTRKSIEGNERAAKRRADEEAAKEKRKEEKAKEMAEKQKQKEEKAKEVAEKKKKADDEAAEKKQKIEEAKAEKKRKAEEAAEKKRKADEEKAEKEKKAEEAKKQKAGASGKKRKADADGEKTEVRGEGAPLSKRQQKRMRKGTGKGTEEQKGTSTLTLRPPPENPPQPPPQPPPQLPLQPPPQLPLPPPQSTSQDLPLLDTTIAFEMPFGLGSDFANATTLDRQVQVYNTWMNTSVDQSGRRAVPDELPRHYWVMWLSARSSQGQDQIYAAFGRQVARTSSRAAASTFPPSPPRGSWAGRSRGPGFGRGRGGFGGRGGHGAVLPPRGSPPLGAPAGPRATSLGNTWTAQNTWTAPWRDTWTAPLGVGKAKELEQAQTTNDEKLRKEKELLAEKEKKAAEKKTKEEAERKAKEEAAKKGPLVEPTAMEITPNEPQPDPVLAEMKRRLEAAESQLRLNDQRMEAETHVRSTFAKAKKAAGRRLNEARNKSHAARTTAHAAGNSDPSANEASRHAVAVTSAHQALVEDLSEAETSLVDMLRQVVDAAQLVGARSAAQDEVDRAFDNLRQAVGEADARNSDILRGMVSGMREVAAPAHVTNQLYLPSSDFPGSPAAAVVAGRQFTASSRRPRIEDVSRTPLLEGAPSPVSFGQLQLEDRPSNEGVDGDRKMWDDDDDDDYMTS